MPSSRAYSNLSTRRQRRITAIGDLDRKIQLQYRVLSSKFQTADTDRIEFTTLVNAWAKVETLKGYLEYDGVEMTQRGWTHSFTIRYRDDYEQFKWILWKGKRYEILQAEVLDERDEFVLCRCLLTGTNEKTNEASWA